MSLRPNEHYVRINDVELCYFEWGSKNNPPLLLLHATGFHGRVWDEVSRQFAESCHVIAPDFRGHGRSGKVPPFNWMQFGDDIGKLVQLLELKNLCVIGHSMGGHCAITLAGTDPSRYSSLLLIDPVVFSPSEMDLREERMLQSDTSTHPVAKRRNSWDSPEEMFRNFSKREPFSHWNQQVLRDYCEHGLLRNGDSGYALACPPDIEATVYTDSGNVGNFELMPNITQPVTIIRARRRQASDSRMDFSSSPTWPELVGRFVNGRDIHRPDLSHFIPMEQPDLVARYIRAMFCPETDGDTKVQ